MTQLKKILLGTAAASMAMTGVAVAADAPAPVFKDRTPVYACDQTGFWELPGTDVCFKVGGYAKADFIWTTNEFRSDSESAFSADQFLFDNDGDLITADSRTDGDKVRFHARQSRLNFDARSNTEYGLVRAFIEFDFFGTDAENGGSSRPRLRHAFVQFGNLLAGQTWSTFADLNTSPNTIDFNGPLGNHSLRTAQIRWTQSFGDGFSFSIALENPETNGIFSGSEFTAASATLNADGTVTLNPATGSLTSAPDEGFPDLAANINLTQSWGHVQLSGVIGQRSYYETGLNAASTSVTVEDDEFVWAAMLSGSFNFPIAGNSDTIRWGVAYADGASEYFTGPIPGTFVDADTVNIGGVDTVETISAWASLEHQWTDTLTSNFFFSWLENDDVNTIGGNTSIFGAAAVETAYYAGANIIWSPVPRVDMGLEVLWGKAETFSYTDTNGNVVDADEDGFRIQAAIRRTF